jgi:hypothetical protein
MKLQVKKYFACSTEEPSQWSLLSGTARQDSLKYICKSEMLLVLPVSWVEYIWKSTIIIVFSERKSSIILKLR